MCIKDYFKPIGVDKSIVIYCLFRGSKPQSKRRDRSYQSIEEGVQSGGGGVNKRK